MTNNLMKQRLVKQELKRTEYWLKFSKTCPNCYCANHMKPTVEVMRCKICGTLIYRDEKTEFKYELRKRLK